MRVLVSGGAGYIGAHMCKLLARHGHEPVVFDNLSTGHREFVRWGPLEVGDLLNPADLDRVLEGSRFDLVMQFAGLIAAGESVEKPALYHQNNVTGSRNLLEAMRRHGLKRLVFSSSAAVYGSPASLPVAEDAPRAPINPYGRNKLEVEDLLAEAAQGWQLSSVSLRYFNAAGADPEAEIGELHEPETHLIPLLLRAALNRGAPARILGADYPTPDGTCVRDYIHVQDLCAAHLQAAGLLQRSPGAHYFNLGNGAGFSVLQVLRAAERVVGHAIRCEMAPRRAGDCAILVADARLARRVLGWAPQHQDIGAIIESAWRWHRKGLTQ